MDKDLDRPIHTPDPTTDDHPYYGNCPSNNQEDTVTVGEADIIKNLTECRHSDLRVRPCDGHCPGILSVRANYRVLQILGLQQADETLRISGWFTIVSFPTIKLPMQANVEK
ncbi:hypothetical protein Ciccas_008785 [Cichlidogyrus casuarinus]|uniref:Uncharacterized protein n=1 Tax=Cichlidogyrus casuarinus TaxID=1844966 RepID=A0ABD2Q382_9PLAT